jgi:hypothetical protein
MTILLLLIKITGSAPDAFREVPAGHLSQWPQARKLAK